MTSASPSVWAMLVFTAMCSVISAEDRAAEEFFEKEVRPILAAKCLECHGEQDPEAGFQLLSRETLLKGGKTGPGIHVDKPQESLLLVAIKQTGELKMPPEEHLREDQIAVISKWLDMGAPWPATATASHKKEFAITEADRDHWAFRPIQSPPVPSVKQADWPLTAIDNFVLAKQEAAGIVPAPTADRATLIRRVYYDLIGLPPTIEDVNAFVSSAEPTDKAVAAVVDQLLTSPRYGEKWARHWLDVARYADTKDGVLMYGDDRIRPYAYTYRDYVIRALNEDLPYNQFVIDQLAADQVEPPVEPWRLGAMGLLTLGRLYDNNIHDVIDDQIDTVTRGFLGLTVSCTRCHDHKYDPVSTADYYSLYGVFASCEVPIELPLIQPADQVPGGPEFEKEAAPKREAITRYQADQHKLLTRTAHERTGDYLAKVATTEPDPLETAIFFFSLSPEDLRPQIVGRWRQFIRQRATSTDPVFGPWVELMQIPTPPLEGDAAKDPNAMEQAAVGFSAAALPIIEKWRAVPTGVSEGQVNPLIMQALTVLPIRSKADVARAYGTVMLRVDQNAQAANPPGPDSLSPEQRQLWDIIASRESPNDIPLNQTRKYMSRQQTDQFGGMLTELDRLAAVNAGAPPRAMVVRDKSEIYEPKIFVRGNPSSPGKPVPRQFIEVISPPDRPKFTHGSGRIDLARSIASEANPLTARIIVNRVWMFHFGEPLVSTPSDFGTRCKEPVQIDLLNHLAAQFIQDGWSLKKLHRRILNSRVWQQSSHPAPETAELAQQKDPDNSLLWRANRRRLELESMRDSLLAVAGRLKERSGGKPVDVTANPAADCRTVYGLVDRQSVPAMFRAFDFASPDVSNDRRPRTVVPQQALFSLNSALVREQAKALAARPEIANAAQPDEKVRALYRLVFLREPTEFETKECVAFAQQPADPATQMSPWDQLAQVLVSSNEFLYLD